MFGSRSSILQPVSETSRTLVLCRGWPHASQQYGAPAAPECSRAAAAPAATLTRRAALLASVLVPVAHKTHVWAQEVQEVPPLPKPGTSPYGSKVLTAPGEFLRARQRLNGGEKILAPIRASQRKLKARSYSSS
ncbi:hypothetical protein WJX73_008746 [Symbiochloris irregularis]|uniref:Uncharacterized protein n=1 Tax=Symbiochloris irregularis TaxID=706552 RepID=A0AAW1NXP7_9CHLO